MDYQHGIVTANVLNIREGAGVNNPVIKRIIFGTTITILEKQLVGETWWFRIGVDQWVHSGWIRIV